MHRTPLWLQDCFYAIIFVVAVLVVAAAIRETGILTSVHDVTCRYVFTEEQTGQP